MALPKMQKITLVNQSCAVASSPFSFDVSKWFNSMAWGSDLVLAWEVARTAGSSTCDGKLQTSVDGGSTYRDGDSFTQVSGATGGEVKQVLKFADKMKLVITIGSASTFTVKVYLIGLAVGPKLGG